MEFGGTLSQVTLETLRQYLKETPHRSYAYGIDDSRARHPEAIVSVVSEVDKLLEDEGTKIGTNRDGSNSVRHAARLLEWGFLGGLFFLFGWLGD